MNEFVDCQLCGEHHDIHWSRDIAERLLLYRICFSCDHWRGCWQIGQKPESRHRVFVADGVHYMIDRETNAPAHARGFGGSQFRVRFIDDGTIVESTNVWCQGAIPQLWRVLLPDNAEILTDVHYSRRIHP